MLNSLVMVDTCERSHVMVASNFLERERTESEKQKRKNFSLTRAAHRCTYTRATQPVSLSADSGDRREAGEDRVTQLARTAGPAGPRHADTHTAAHGRFVRF